MMHFCIDAEQLRKALADIEKAEQAGFMYCLAVFDITQVGHMLDDVRASYSDLLERAHPTDDELDWGRFQGVSRHYRFDGEKLVAKDSE
jgi:hypothetical protein